ncbi:protein G12 [Eurosta solidaginis]|uniref:protein G12 n=1 Tax=Eurosta solidaginis TaxID=178769 RepID=UPI003530796F
MQLLIITLTLVASFCSSWALPPLNAPATAAVGPPPPATLTQDLEELFLLIPSRPLNKLVIRYLLNDEQFQAVVRIINSHDAYMVRMRLKAQPELIQFHAWVRSQLILSGGGSLEFEESEEILRLFNPTPYWSVYGWQGFFSEFLAYFPYEMLRAHIDAKVMQGGSMAQLWTKVKALLPVYERFLAFPETKRIIAQLEQHGVVFSQLDEFIRSLFDWYNLNPVGTQAIGLVPKDNGTGVISLSVGGQDPSVGGRNNAVVVVPVDNQVVV